MTSLPQAPRLPAVFGRYVLLHRLSRGGMGEIFLAKLGEIQGFEKPIVIKKILQHLAQDEEFLHRFIEEAQIAIKLTHGNIVPVYEVGMVDNEYFLALQYIEGRDLRRLGKRCLQQGRRLPPDLCLYLVREITNGLAYAHRLTDEEGRAIELVHCDISPPNILVTYEGEVKIIDFGIAKSAVQRAQEDDSVGFGKLGYMAPEQLLRGSRVDRRADIYATGVLLYELLTGQRLFSFDQGTDFRRIMAEVTAGRISPPSQRNSRLPEGLDQLVLRALKTAPEERYQSAEEFRDAIQRQLYAMNPSISADALAAFIQGLFSEDQGADRAMMRSLSQTDVEPFQTALHESTTHTVSYALAGLISQSTGTNDKVMPPLTVAAAQGGVGSVHAAAAGGPPPGTGTRRMGDMERVQAAEESRRGTTAQVVAPERRVVIALAVVLSALLAGGIIAGLLIPLGPESLVEERAAADAGSPSVAPARQAVDLAVSSRAQQADSATSRAGDDGGPLTFAPQILHQTPKKKTRRGRHRRRTRKKPRRAKPDRRTAEISPTQVQRKFRQVHREYKSFTRSFGKRLEREWQEIMFTNTYGKDDKYLRLNNMLNSLRTRMNTIRKRDG